MTINQALQMLKLVSKNKLFIDIVQLDKIDNLFVELFEDL